MGDWLVTAFQSRAVTEAGFVYTGNLIALDNAPPFRPMAAGPRPLFVLTPDELAMRPSSKLNMRVAHCLYPAGLSVDEHQHRLTLTYGINDYRCGYRQYASADLSSCLLPLTQSACSARPMSDNASTQDTSTPVSPALLRSFYWRPPSTNASSPEAVTSAHFLFGNVGDSLQTHINTALFGMSTYHVENEGYRLLGAGSIAHRALPGDIIWGSGFKEVPLKLSQDEKETLEVRAVRGPLTADYLARNGVDVSNVAHFFDPGALIGELFPSQIAECRKQVKRPTGILLIPHYKDTVRFMNCFAGRGYRIKSVDCDLFEMIQAIVASELVMSSSLHGVILAEAVGVPALLMTPPASEPFTKYQDYYSGTLRHNFPVVDDPKDAAVARIPEAPSIPSDWRSTLPCISALQARRLAEPVLSLDADQASTSLAPAYHARTMHLDIGRFSGDRFILQIDTAAREAVQLQVSDRDAVISQCTIQTGLNTHTCEIDGEAVEAHGGVLHLSLRGAASGRVVIPQTISARFAGFPDTTKTLCAAANYE